MSSNLCNAAEPVRLFKVFIPPTAGEQVLETLASGYIGEGPRTAEFEKRLSQFLEVPDVLALNSGTSAIQLALRLAGVGPGDEVISTPMTCVATNQPILQTGARLVWADVQGATGNISPEDIARKITSRTRALMVMHWGGNPCEMESIHSIASEYGLTVIEDACHAIGAAYNGVPIGAHSDFVCFSFQAIKTMTTGDGGALVCRNPELNERGRKLRWYGLDRSLGRNSAFLQQDITECGYKMHMNDIAATVGLEQLQHVRDNVLRARANAKRYDNAFSNLVNVQVAASSAKAESSCWLYTLLVDDRALFSQMAEQHGIEVSPVHARNDRYSVFRDSVTDLRGVDEFDQRHICIPVGWWLTEADVQRVIDLVTSYDESYSRTATLAHNKLTWAAN